MPGQSADLKKKKRPNQLLKNVAHSHFLQTDGHASLPFMQQINIFSTISAIPQLRSNTGKDLDITVYPPEQQQVYQLCTSTQYFCSVSMESGIT